MAFSDRPPPLLGLDVGTTHCKAAAYGRDGRRYSHAARDTPTRRDADGRPYFDPDELWLTVAALFRDLNPGGRVEIVGVAGMAEAGLLVDRHNGVAKSEIIPWYDPRST